MKYNHNLHLVNISPWPLMTALGSMYFLMSIINLFNNYKSINIILFFMLISIMSYQWWRDVIRESTLQGLHSTEVFKNMKLGMILFITSEIFFFFSFFWSYFHMSLAQSIELGMNWPPYLINTFNPFMIPLLNTIILLSSGISITWSHYSLINNNLNNFKKSLFMTIFMGIYFSLIQSYEYKEAMFSIADSCYGSIFFLTTGFHGIHVLIGTIFLIVSLMRSMNIHFSKNHHFGFEAAAWYWHFVDIVWLFLFISIYWWGN